MWHTIRYYAYSIYSALNWQKEAGYTFGARWVRVIFLSRGGDLGGLGDGPLQKNLRWGTAHALVPPIF